MRFSEIILALRNTSQRYGGIKHFTAAADGLKAALDRFMEDPDEGTLSLLTGAHAHAVKMLGQARVYDMEDMA